jgi:hypothetical protein
MDVDPGLRTGLRDNDDDDERDKIFKSTSFILS